MNGLKLPCFLFLLTSISLTLSGYAASCRHIERRINEQQQRVTIYSKHLKTLTEQYHYYREQTLKSQRAHQRGKRMKDLKDYQSWQKKELQAKNKIEKIKRKFIKIRQQLGYYQTRFTNNCAKTNNTTKNINTN